MNDFELGQIEKETRRLIICTGCYGSGQREWSDGRCEICERCNGLGKAAAEPHVIRLVELVRTMDATLLEERYASAARIDELSQQVHESKRAAALEDAVKRFVNQYPWQNSPEILELAAFVEEP